MIKNLGPARDSVVRSVEAILQEPSSDVSLGIASERIWHWGVDGKEEREQLVARFRRGIAFVHIYRYGNDLYVGWDAHVNCGDWIEVPSGAGFDKTTQELCRVNTISAGWHVPSEYDISDTNCLLEQVHAAVVKVVKLKLAEHQIDQEIDFKILREPRQSIAGRRDSADDDEGGLKGVLSRFRRVE
jgi:hypothetical protein